jgi:NTE family protein
MDIVQLIYRPSEPEGHSKDYEFSRSSMERRWRQGLADAQGALRASPWLAPMPKELGVRVFDMDESFSAEKVADRCNFPRKEPAGFAERTAKTPPTLVQASQKSA